MQTKPIDIEEEKAILWRKVYCDFSKRILLGEGVAVYAKDVGLVHINCDCEGVMILTNQLGEKHHIEEYDDEVLFELYQSYLNSICH